MLQVNKRIFLFFVVLMLINFSCKTLYQNKYGECPQKEYANAQCPFVVLFEKDSIVADTLFYSATIVNISDSLQIISVDPFVNHAIYNHPTLRLGYVIGYRSVDFLNECSSKREECLTCENCFYYYSISHPFKGLKKNESFKVHRKQHIVNLNSLIKGDSFYILGFWYIPEYIEPYCPKIWTGSISGIAEIKV